MFFFHFFFIFFNCFILNAADFQKNEFLFLNKIPNLALEANQLSVNFIVNLTEKNVCLLFENQKILWDCKVSFYNYLVLPIHEKCSEYAKERQQQNSHYAISLRNQQRFVAPIIILYASILYFNEFENFKKDFNDFKNNSLKLDLDTLGEIDNLRNEINRRFSESESLMY